jgi:hypothetical protein
MSTRTIVKSNPIGTLRCAHPRCEEIIYRDTLDKDEAWQVSNAERNKYTCSEKHAEELSTNNLYWNMSVNNKWYKQII